MLDLFTEFAEIRAASSGHPIDALIADVLDSYRVQWTFANDLGLIFVVVYQRILQLTYIEELLDLAKESFVTYSLISFCDPSALHVYDYDEAFDIILNGLEGRANAEKKKVPRKFKTLKIANTLEVPKGREGSGIWDRVSTRSPNDIAGKLKKLQLARSGKKSPAKKDLPLKEGNRPKKKVLRSWNGSIPEDGGKKLDFSESKDDADVQADQWVEH
ncbi:signal recognition particle, alpha subunit, N-terminal-domain-containing protein [Chytridium lagenaria]|nr:signal recognition particle, alpha subunit, N-terminal-domain-containing protein [Chytridium lagenaria]